MPSRSSTPTSPSSLGSSTRSAKATAAWRLASSLPPDTVTVNDSHSSCPPGNQRTCTKSGPNQMLAGAPLELDVLHPLADEIRQHHAGHVELGHLGPEHRVGHELVGGLTGGIEAAADPRRDRGPSRWVRR